MKAIRRALYVACVLATATATATPARAFVSPRWHSPIRALHAMLGHWEGSMYQPSGGYRDTRAVDIDDKALAFSLLDGTASTVYGYKLRSASGNIVEVDGVEVPGTPTTLFTLRVDDGSLTMDLLTPGGELWRFDMVRTRP